MPINKLRDTPTPRELPGPDDRQPVLTRARTLKMARSAHAYVRGSTVKFYEWLDANGAATLPEGPPLWICGDCHIGNLGPVANDQGEVEIQIRDFDQTVIGNPAHDLVRLGLSLAMAARSADLPGVVTARMLEEMMAGYRRAFDPAARRGSSRPASVRIALKTAQRRTWRHLAQERVDGKTVRIPLGARFWPVSAAEREEIGRMFEADELRALATRLRHRDTDAPVALLDTAYWLKGCSSLGRLRFAAMLDVGGLAREGRDLCLTDIKEAVKTAAPRAADAATPRENARRVVEGARHLSPYLGERMIASRLSERSVVVRELLPQDLKLEFADISPSEARKAAHYLALIVGRAHARQLDDATRERWHAELARSQTKSLDAPSWLWNAVVDLVGMHEKGYLEHCRRHALALSKRGSDRGE